MSSRTLDRTGSSLSDLGGAAMLRSGSTTDISDSMTERSDIVSARSAMDDYDQDSAQLVRNCTSSSGAERASDSIEKKSTIHTNLINALNSSSKIKPVFCDVKNESYWYNMRHQLGPKRANAIITKNNPNTLKWDAFIYKIKRRESDLELVPTKVAVGNGFKTKWIAFKNCEKAIKERDENPATTKKLALTMTADKILSTHFKIVLVSSVFERMPPVERLALVYNELLDALGVNILPISHECNSSHDHLNQHGSSSSVVATSLGRCAPTKMKIGSTFGDRMCSLDIFRFLLPADGAPLHLIINALTPSQWRPELYKPLVSERFGGSHVGLRVLQVDKAAKPSGTKARIKKLAQVVVNPSSLSAAQRLQMEAEQASSHNKPGSANGEGPMDYSDSIGFDHTISGVEYKRQGGIYGHFFNDLSGGIKDMVMAKVKDNKHLIQNEGNAAHNKEVLMKQKLRAAQLAAGVVIEENDFQPKTSMSILKSKMQNALALADYDKGTSNEIEMMEEVNIKARRIERVAIRLQRIRRMNMLSRACKRLWRRKWAALTIQRIARGMFGYQYAQLFRVVKSPAVIRIQHCWLHMKTRVIIKRWRYLTYHLTRVVLPKIKRFIRNCFLSWIVKRNRMAVIIQSVVRIYVAKSHYYKKIGQKYFVDKVFPTAAIKIQKIIRAFLGKLRFQRHLKWYLVEHIDNLAALRLQRIYRGRIGKRLRREKQHALECCIKIQRLIKFHVRKIWNRQLHRAQLEKRSATAIQRIFRGMIDREIYKNKAEKHWYVNTFLPSVIMVQAVSRRYTAIKKANIKRNRHHAAVFLQRVYRFYRQRLVAIEYLKSIRTARKFAAAAQIQKIVRRYFAIKKIGTMRLAYRGKVIKAVKVIMRAWVNYKVSRRFRVMMDIHRRTLFNKKMEKYSEARREVDIDINDIKKDIALTARAQERLKSRLTDLTTFELQANVRIGKVKMEMTMLTTEDFERGWAEALTQEYEYLNHQALMAREEIRLHKYNINKRQKELTELYIELENSEIDIDQLEMLEVDAFEALHRDELNAAIRLADEEMARNIRREKSHWRVDSVRTKVIRKNRPRFQAIVAKAKAERDVNFATTISFEKRQAVVDREELITEARLDAEFRKIDAESKPKTYEDYATPVQNTYDNIVGNTLGILRGFTLEERASKLHDQFKKTENKLKKSRMGQFGALKPENQKDTKLR